MTSSGGRTGLPWFQAVWVHCACELRTRSRTGTTQGDLGRRGLGPRAASQVLATWLSGSYFLGSVFPIVQFPSLPQCVPRVCRWDSQPFCGFHNLGRRLGERPRAPKGRGYRGWGSCVQALVA